jgi:nucleoside-diphosphate-sugar epimerase
MTILLTGGTGLVGARLLRRFAQAGIACRALVRSGKALPEHIEAVEGDLLDPASLVSALDGASAVVHLAAVFRTSDESLIWQVNLEGTRNLVEAVQAQAPLARCVMASTTNVYAPDNPHPGREDDAVHPTLAYPASKIAAEQVVRDSGLNWAILRFGFVYGEQDGHLEAVPGHAAKAGWHPASKMSMVHHRDIATAVDLALSGAFDRHVVNIVDEAPTSIYELAVLADAPVPASARPLPDPWRLHADGALARKLGFRPKVATIYQAQREGLL